MAVNQCTPTNTSLFSWYVFVLFKLVLSYVTQRFNQSKGLNILRFTTHSKKLVLIKIAVTLIKYLTLSNSCVNCYNAKLFHTQIFSIWENNCRVKKWFNFDIHIHILSCLKTSLPINCMTANFVCYSAENAILLMAAN